MNHVCGSSKMCVFYVSTVARELNRYRLFMVLFRKFTFLLVYEYYSPKRYFWNNIKRPTTKFEGWYQVSNSINSFLPTSFRQNYKSCFQRLHCAQIYRNCLFHTSFSRMTQKPSIGIASISFLTSYEVVCRIRANLWMLEPLKKEEFTAR